jgi:hypothetical protein
LNCDATQFDLPPIPSLLYFYNPFKLELMQRMVRNVIRSSAECPRPIFLVFLNPTVIHDFELPPELEKVAEKAPNWRRPALLILRVSTGSNHAPRFEPARERAGVN